MNIMISRVNIKCKLILFLGLLCLIIILLIGVVCRIEIKDWLRDRITSVNCLKGIIASDEIQWCSLPISHDLDQGGVPDGIRDITHPSVVFADSSTHTWWLAATPYPQSLSVSGEPYENTCIFYSDNDSLSPPINFSSIKKNPIIYKQDAKYNSDPDIFFDNNSKKLFALTRKRWGEDYVSNIVVQHSFDGEIWSNPTSILKTDTESLCPCLLETESGYRLYLFEPDMTDSNVTKTIQIWESASLDNMEFKHIKSVLWNLNSNFWHGDVVRYNDMYYMVYCGTNNTYQTCLGTRDLSKYLWIATSNDGITFQEYKTPILQMNGVYRASFVIVNDVITCYFSVSNRYRSVQDGYPSGNRIGMIQFNLDILSELDR